MGRRCPFGWQLVECDAPIESTACKLENLDNDRKTTIEPVYERQNGSMSPL